MVSGGRVAMRESTVYTDNLHSCYLNRSILKGPKCKERKSKKNLTVSSRGIPALMGKASFSPFAQYVNKEYSPRIPHTFQRI
jgi:hypothetical protein